MGTLTQHAAFVGIEFLVEAPAVARHCGYVIALDLSAEDRVTHKRRMGVLWKISNRHGTIVNPLENFVPILDQVATAPGYRERHRFGRTVGALSVSQFFFEQKKRILSFIRCPSPLRMWSSIVHLVANPLQWP